MERDHLYILAAAGLLASGAGLGVIDIEREKLFPLAGNLFGFPECQSNEPLDLGPNGNHIHLSKETTSKILRAARGALPTQLQIQANSTLFALFLTPPLQKDKLDKSLQDSNHELSELKVIFITFPIRDIENFMLRPEEAGVLAMPLLESFHELARPIGVTSMLLSKLRLDSHLEANLEKNSLATWRSLCLAETMVSKCFYPMIKYLGLIEKYGQLGIGPYEAQGYKLGASLEETGRGFLESLKIASSTPFFSDFGISADIFEVRDQLCDFQIPSRDPLVEIPRPLLDVITTELLINAIKHLPRNAEIYDELQIDTPIRVTVTNMDNHQVRLGFENIHQVKRRIDSLRDFKYSIMSRPLGGLAGVLRLVRSVGWNLDFELRPIPGLDERSIYYFDLEIRGTSVQ